MLLAREALFLRRGDDAALVEKRSGAVVIERGDTEYTHGQRSRLEDRVDERRHRAALGEHQEPAEQEQHDENRQQPKLLPDPHEGP